MVDPFVREDPDTAWEKRLMEILWDDSVEEMAEAHKAHQNRDAMLRLMMPVMDGEVPASVAAQQSGQSEAAVRARVHRLREEVRRILKRKAAVAFGL